MLESIRNYINKYSRYRKTIRELYSLTPRELHDIGVSYCDIENIARQVWDENTQEKTGSTYRLAMELNK